MSERSRRLKWRLGAGISAAALLVGVVMVAAAIAGSVGTASGFEDDDGNLVANSTFDWNSFTPTTWTGTAPYRTSSKLAGGWQFTGIEDDQASTTDTAFAGGTKQDDNCPSVIGAKAPNKGDLKRIYLSTKTVSNHIYLNLAWVRIPQNTTSPSAHVAFEFSKGSTACGAGSDGLVRRTAGDMLIVYDFEGGTTDIPKLTLRRWVTSGACEITTDSAPCWGTAVNLTAAGFADAKVNTDATALDTIGPAGSVTLGKSEFGEAGIDLTAAGVFTANTCESFGKVYGVSRSSGNSGEAQMKDLVGPGNITIANCGSLLIHKTDGTNGLAGATFTATPGSTNSAGVTATSSTFVDQAPAHVGYYCLDNMKLGQSTLVHESQAPAGYNPDATDQTITVTNTASCATRLAATTITADGSDFVDTPQVGAIQITKDGKDKSCTGVGAPDASCSAASTRLLSGAVFELKTGSTVNYTSDATSTAGVTCIGGVTPGSYTLHEKTAPSGYAKADNQTVTIAANTSCSGTGAQAPLAVSVTDQPLTTMTVTTTPAVTGTTTSTVQCTPSTATGDTAAVATPHTTDAVIPGTYVCTVVIDP